MKVPFSKPFFDSKEEKAVINVLRSGWHTQGPQTELFEKEFANYVKAKYAVAVSNCTSALHMGLILANIQAGDEVIVPSFTFIASVNVIKHVNATPVFADVDENTFNIEPKEIEKKITKKTKAIIAVDQVGLPCDIDAINKIAAKKKLFVLEDAACALGAEYKGKMVGSLSTISCFSLHPRKVISTGEGGVLTTNNLSIAKKARELRSHGASVSAFRRHNAQKVFSEKYENLGYNYRISDIQSAIGREQLKKISIILKKRQSLAQRYTKKLSKIPFISTPFVPPYAKHNWQTYIIKLEREKSFPYFQKQLMQKLLDKSISTRKGVMASHLEPYYKKIYTSVSLPNSEDLANSTIALPLFPEMTVVQQDYVIDSLESLLLSKNSKK